MATYYTTQAQKEFNNATNDPALGYETRGGVYGFVTKYTLLGTEVATDKIRLCKLRRNDVVKVDLSSVYCEDPGTALVVDIGDNDSTADPDRYVEDVDLSAGGQFQFTADPGVALLTPHCFVNDEGWLEVTIVTATTLTADAELTFAIYLQNVN